MCRASTLRSLFALCVSAAFLLSTTESYTCTQCSQEQCSSNPTATCSTSQACFSLQQEFNSSGYRIAVVQEKGCSSGPCAPLAFSVTLGDNKTFSYDHQCCHLQQCNKVMPVAPKSSNPNGVECRACYSETRMSCDPVLLKCSGAETRCIEVMGTVTIKRIPYFTLFGMGCATESACNLELNILNDTNVRSYCVGSTPRTSSTSAIPPGLFLLSLALMVQALGSP